MDHINYSVQCLSVRGERKMPTKKSKNKNYFIKSLPFMVQIFGYLGQKINLWPRISWSRYSAFRKKTQSIRRTSCWNIKLELCSNRCHSKHSDNVLSEAQIQNHKIPGISYFKKGNKTSHKSKNKNENSENRSRNIFLYFFSNGVHLYVNIHILLFLEF